MSREEMSNATAALMAKFSVEARARKKELQIQLRALAIESLDLVTGEMQRLSVEEGKDFGDALVTIELVRKQMEAVDFNALDLAVLEQVMIAGNAYDAMRQCSSQVQERRDELRSQMRPLLLEDLDITLAELRRLSQESIGREAVDYAEASVLLGLMRQQMGTENLDDSKMGGSKTIAGVFLGVVRDAAKDEIQKQSRDN
jgi:hypothetical protein